jgi:hypothetical protein
MHGESDRKRNPSRAQGAARRSFAKVRGRNTGETFYVFALYTDDDASGVSPASNTAEGYGRRLGRYRNNAGFMESLKEMGLEFSPFDYKWGHPEWAFEAAESGEFEAADALIRDESRQEDYVEARAGVFAAMVLALKDLDAGGFFGAGDERARVTLMCSASDSAATAWLEDESARALNPPGVYQAFFAEWITNSVMKEGLDAYREGPDEVSEAFSRILRGAS